MTNKKNSFRQRTHDGVDNMMDKAENLRARSQDATDSLKAKVRDINYKIEEYINERPKKSILVATGIGIVLGAGIMLSVMRRKK